MSPESWSTMRANLQCLIDQASRQFRMHILHKLGVTNLQYQIDQVKDTDGVKCTNTVANTLGIPINSSTSDALKFLHKETQDLIQAILNMANYTKTADYNSPGTYSHKAKGTKAVAIIIGGGGGGGGGARNLAGNSQANSGGGGSGGGAGGVIVTDALNITKNSTYNIVVGVAGTGGKKVYGSYKVTDLPTAGGSSSAFSNVASGGNHGIPGDNQYGGPSPNNGSDGAGYGGNGGGKTIGSGGSAGQLYGSGAYEGISYATYGGSGGSSGAQNTATTGFGKYVAGALNPGTGGSGGSGGYIAYQPSVNSDGSVNQGLVAATDGGAALSYGSGGGGGGGGSGAIYAGSRYDDEYYTGTSDSGKGGNGYCGRVVIYESGIFGG